MKWNYISWLIIIALFLVILMQRNCNNSKGIAPKADTVTQHDTTWLPSKPDTVKIEVPKLVASTPQAIPDAYKPSDNCDEVTEQYKILAQEHFTTNTYRDSSMHDSTLIVANSTVSENKLQSSSIEFYPKYQVITDSRTITEPYNPVRQVYLGGGVTDIGRLDGLVLHGGLLYKSRRDNITELHAGIDNTGRGYYGISAYWKIRLRKQP